MVRVITYTTAFWLSALMWFGIWALFHAVHAQGTGLDMAPASPGVIHAQAIIQLIEPFVTDVGGAIALALIAWIGNHIKNNFLRQAFESAVTRAGQGVYEQLVAKGKTIDDVKVKNAAIGSMVNDLTANFATTMKLFKITPDTAAAMVQKSLGGVLALDPTVTVASAPKQISPPVTVLTAAPGTSGAPMEPVPVTLTNVSVLPGGATYGPSALPPTTP